MFSIFNRRHAAFELSTPLMACVLPTVCSPKATFKVFNVSVEFFSVSQKIDADVLSFQACHFLGTPKSHVEQHTLVLKSLLKNHAC